MSVPVTVCGNGVGLLGDASGGCAPAGTSGAAASGDSGSSLLAAPVSVPVTVCGNGVGLFGSAATDCSAGSGTDPITPIVPAVPSMPLVPGTPNAPTVPGRPTVAGGLSVMGSATIAGDGDRVLIDALTAQSSSARSLAYTGAGVLDLVGLAGLLMLLGGVLGFTTSRRNRSAA